MSSLKKHLKDAQKTGQAFRSTLKESQSFNRTKWFDTLASRIKPAVLALVVAAGATGCSTMAPQAMQDAQFPGGYQNVVTEVAQLNTLPPENLKQVIESRQQSDQYKNLERVTVKELAQRLVDGGKDTAKVLDTPVVIDNPYQPGKLVRVSSNQDLSTNWDLMMNHGMGGITDVIAIRNFHSPFAFNSNHASDEAKSLRADASPSFIVLPKIMSESTWAFGSPEKSVEAISDILFHELAHTTMVQEMNLYGGDNPESQSAVEANGDTYRILNENHSEISAPIASYKAFDLEPDDFVRRLEFMVNNEKTIMKNIGLKGAPTPNTLSHGDYRPGKGLEVLIEITKKDPEFLKNLSYDAIPQFANDIAKKAGYFYNTPEVIAETSLKKVFPTMGEPLSNTRDSQLIQDVLRYLPNEPATETAKSAAKELKNTWSQYYSQMYIDQLDGALIGFSVFDDYQMSEWVLNQSAHPISELKVQPDAQATLIDIVNEVRESTQEGQGMTPELARSIQKDLQALSASLTPMEELEQKRADLINIIQEEMTSLEALNAQTDPTYRIARGTGENAALISESLMATYGDTQWFEGGPAGGQTQIAKPGAPEAKEVKAGLNDAIAAKYTENPDINHEPSQAPGM